MVAATSLPLCVIWLGLQVTLYHKEARAESSTRFISSGVYAINEKQSVPKKVAAPQPANSQLLTECIPSISLAVPFRSISLERFTKLLSNSAIIFRGETDIFDFHQIQVMQIPYYHITNAQVKPEIDVYLRVKALTRTSTIYRSIRHQVVIHGIAQRWRPNMSNMDVENEKLTILPVYPQTALIFTTDKEIWYQYLRYKGGIFEAFSSTGSSMLFVLNYNLEIEKTENSYVICSLCRFQKHMVLFPPDDGRPAVKQFIALSFEIDGEASIVDAMSRARANITKNGSGIIWQLPYDIKTKYSDPKALIHGNEHAQLDFGMGAKPNLLGQNKLVLAIVKVLFPSEQSTSCMRKGQGLISHCLLLCESRHYYANSIVIPCENRGIRYATVQSNDGGHPEVAFQRYPLEDREVVFITSEKLIFSRGYSPLELFLSVFDPTVWILLLSFFIVISGLLSFALEGMINRVKDPLTIEPLNLRVGFSSLCYVIAYLTMITLSQSYGPHPGAKWVKYKRHFAASFMFWAPWVIGYQILTNWYTACMKSSFAFPFPYELSVQQWRDFQNFSLYILLNKSKKDQFVFGNGQDECERTMLKWDLQDFKGTVNCSEIRKYVPPHSSGMSTSFYFDLMSAARSFKGQYDEDYRKHVILDWLKKQWERTISCLKYAENSTSSGSSPSNCIRDIEILQKMLYRVDAIGYDEIPMYVAGFYQNLTQKARRAGVRLIRKLGHQSLSDDNHPGYCWSNPKRNYITAHLGENCSIGNTFYWMTRRPEAAFVTTLTDFPWHWNLFKKLMKRDKTLKFAHTGPKASINQVMGGDGGRNGFKSPLQVIGPSSVRLPEIKWMLRRIRALTHSGILDFLAYWEQILYRPTDDVRNQFIEETATGFQVLTMRHESMVAIFVIFMWLIVFGKMIFLVELSFRVFVG